MTDSPPDFYMTSAGEGYRLEDTRKCYRRMRLRDGWGDDVLLVEIDPPLIGQPYGLGGEDISLLLLKPRSQGESLFPMTRSGMGVNVGRLLKRDVHDGETIANAELEFIAIAFIFATEEEAREWEKRGRRDSTRGGKPR